MNVEQTERLLAAAERIATAQEKIAIALAGAAIDEHFEQQASASTASHSFEVVFDDQGKRIEIPKQKFG